MFKGTMANWPVQKLTRGTTQNSYNIITQQTVRQTIFFLFFGFLFFYFLKHNTKTKTFYKTLQTYI